ALGALTGGGLDGVGDLGDDASFLLGLVSGVEDRVRPAVGEPGPVPLDAGLDDLRGVLGDVGVEQGARADAVPVEDVDGAPDPDPGAVLPPAVVERIGIEVERPDARGR